MVKESNCNVMANPQTKKQQQWQMEMSIEGCAVKLNFSQSTVEKPMEEVKKMILSELSKP